MILLLRLLPLTAAILQGGAFSWQLRVPGAYPYFVLVGILFVPAAAAFLSWKRVAWGDLLEKMAPTFILHLSLGFGLLLVESPLARSMITVLAAVSTFVSLELLFLLAFNPAAYPVSGLSRVNIAYVPIATWYAISTSVGFLVFLHSDGIWHVLVAAALGAVLFRTTGHPGATHAQNRTWMLIGLITGIEIGAIGLILPVSMGMQGFIAALIFTAVLRVRRYVYDPKPSVRLAWSETVGACTLFAASLLTAKWL